ncbi:conserved exported hypothetical protein [Rubrivivax sp. A210]|uniref:DUF2946 family protein n=1 Tax=Rubrivivax sp. A210 TaxID=2772301 RepID=UPI0019193018|nr:DUF2946 family protein [Rubrivivax sp. A210]CAD5371847.1 conserved exported hypothetical protein [Rubrivivax sp. A210]
MNALRLRLQPFVWIALVAMLALALMPTVSRALASADAHCDMPAMAGGEHGQHQAQAAAETPPSSAPTSAHHGAGHLEHCPFCALSFAAVGLPPAPPAVVLPLAGAALPALFLQAPRTLFAWRSAQPRGPPLNA